MGRNITTANHGREACYRSKVRAEISGNYSDRSGNDCFIFHTAEQG